jgi:hypothetical protein
MNETEPKTMLQQPVAVAKPLGSQPEMLRREEAKTAKKMKNYL